MIECAPCESVFFSKVEDLFDSNGNITDDAFEKRVNRMFDELFWYANILKSGREAD
mgnify:CR=1 FL=1